MVFFVPLEQKLSPLCRVLRGKSFFMETLYMAMLATLAILAVSGLYVGVTNDAVNFLNAAIGSKAAKLKVILLVASVGIILGVISSSGMMEVARSGMFHPTMFSFHEVMILYVSVMMANVILLDIYNSLGLPTSTTVALVFSLLGAAIAVAVIEDMRRAGALCAATTHYTELKTYALDTDRVSNASCEFDVETLKPTYRLIVGTPGKSNAFAISEKLGLPAEIIRRARDGVDNDSKRFESILEELEASRFKADKALAEAEQMRAEYEAYRKESECLIEKRLADAERELEKARAKAQSMVESARASSDFIMDQLRRLEKQRESERLGAELERARKEIRENLRTHGDAFDPVEVKRDENYVLPRKLRRGDEVLIVSLGKRAVLTEDPDRSGKVGVQAGIIKTKVAISDLQLIEEKKVTSPAKGSGIKATVSRDFRGEIDLRGMTGDEAWSAVDKYFDEALMAGFFNVRLVHGKGTGALKAALWKYLRTDKRIKSFRIGQFGEGDGGVTVVELK